MAVKRLSPSSLRDISPTLQWQTGFTLLELLIVIAVIALGTAGVALAMRGGAGDSVEREALRLSALLDSARGQSRASGMVVTWDVAMDDKNQPSMRWRGLANKMPLPSQWLDAQTEVTLNRPMVLGPDPVIAPQRVRLTIGSESRDVVTDGVGAFRVERP